MPEDEKFLTQDPGEMTPVERDLAMSKIQATGSPYFNETNPLSKIYRDQAEKIYALKYPEPEGRQSELEDQRGLSDILRKEGLNSVVQIEEEAAQARGVATQEAFDKSVKDCENTLRAEWGVDYQKNLTFAKSFFKEVIIEEIDRAWLDHSHPDGTPALSNDPEFIKAFVSVGKILMENNTKYKDEMTKFIRNYKPTRKGKK